MATTAGTPSGKKAPVVLKVAKQSWVETTCVAAASDKKKDPLAAEQPQGTPRKSKVWDGKKALVEEGGTRKYVGGWVDAPGGQAPAVPPRRPTSAPAVPPRRTTSLCVFGLDESSLYSIPNGRAPRHSSSAAGE